MSATALLLALQLLGGPAAGPAGGEFPHDRHARLFPLCTGCHAGVAGAESAPLYPEPVLCGRCHDGARAVRVSWDGASRTASNLAFSHAAHADAAGGPSCATCHGDVANGASAAGLRAERCARCHGGGEHLDGTAPCSRCHVPLVAAAWSAERVGRLPQPASHRAADFIAAHGTRAAGAACATCHARESCERCHLDADRRPAIAQLGRDARIAALVAGRAPRYYRPASHDAEWDWRHGGSAQVDGAACSSCHARASCTTCHASGNPAIAALPAAAPGDERGIRFRRAPRVHPSGFATAHEARGASESACTGCHSRDLCTSCHRGSRDPEFHQRNFLARHGAESFGSDTQCSSCHNAELFCRSCHAETGRGGATRGVVYHGTTPLWLTGHGQAARQSLETCASCHAQNDCTRCHSARGGWGVNPHGPGFAAARLSRANRITCVRCHDSATLESP